MGALLVVQKRCSIFTAYGSQTSRQEQAARRAGFREDAEAGGLMSYGPDLADLFRRSATSVDKILKGANPANCPSSSRRVRAGHQPQDRESLGLTIPA